MCRDITKIFKKKWFAGKNRAILQYPYVHRLAICVGLESEKINRAVEDLQYSILKKLEPP